jgi:hypothetical protein
MCHLLSRWLKNLFEKGKVQRNPKKGVCREGQEGKDRE